MLDFHLGGRGNSIGSYICSHTTEKFPNQTRPALGTSMVVSVSQSHHPVRCDYFLRFPVSGYRPCDSDFNHMTVFLALTYTIHTQRIIVASWNWYRDCQRLSHCPLLIGSLQFINSLPNKWLDCPWGQFDLFNRSDCLFSLVSYVFICARIHFSVFFDFFMFFLNIFLL